VDDKFPLGICEMCRKNFDNAIEKCDWLSNQTVKQTRNSPKVLNHAAPPELHIMEGTVNHALDNIS